MNELKITNSIDFEDMINNANNILDKMISDNKTLPYDYIFVDEYQDISLQRFDLCEKLSKCSNAKIIAVGDDWQSIFRFSGAKLELFTRFQEIMGYANILKITNTYRNSQELIDIAGNFVMQNDSQIKKNLKSSKTLENPIALYTYDDSSKKDQNGNGIGYRVGKTIEHALDNLVREYGEAQSILFIGRYGFEGFNLAKLKNNLFTLENGNLLCNKYPKLKLTYLTAHSSKGLGYDNVIIINAKDAILGFPSKIEDDPVMKLVIKDNDNYEYAEERRLFYVALTRTKNKVYIITPKYKPSVFVLELKEKYPNVVTLGDELSPTGEMSNIIKCPCCGYPMQRRYNKNFNIKGQLWICSNDPEVCGFVTNDIEGGKLCISKCPKCVDGYLIVKTILNGREEKMLGCTNFKPDGTGCSAYLMPNNYTQDKEELDIFFYDEKTDINKVYYCNHLFKEMVDSIIYVLKFYKNMSISPSFLFSILAGEFNNRINTFQMYQNPKFGYITNNDKRKFYLLLDALKYSKIISIDENNYNAINLLKDNLSENNYKEIYASIKL
jgi:DNA helicase-4